MWHRISTVSRSAEHFDAYLEELQQDPGRLENIKQHEARWGDNPPSVMDIIEDWVASDDTILLFDSFESFLLAVIEIAESWAGEDRATVGGFALWPDPGTGEPRTLKRFISTSDETEVWELGVRHRLLVRSNFESHRSQVLARQGTSKKKRK